MTVDQRLFLWGQPADGKLISHCAKNYNGIHQQIGSGPRSALKDATRRPQQAFELSHMRVSQLGAGETFTAVAVEGPPIHQPGELEPSLFFDLAGHDLDKDPDALGIFSTGIPADVAGAAADAEEFPMPVY